MGTTRDWWPGELMGNQQCCHLYGWIGTTAISSPVRHHQILAFRILRTGGTKCLWSWMHCLRMWNSPSQPKATEVYYRTCGVIDQHNRHHQDNLKTEKKLEMKKWDMRVNLKIFSMIVVETWLVYSQVTGSTELQSEFYVRLAEELIDNNIGSRLQHQRNSGEDGSDSNNESPVMTHTGRVCTGISCHLTPTKRRRCTADGELTAQRLQGCCIECGKKTTYLCSACMDNDDESKTPFCVTLKNDQHASPTTISTLI